jgi:DNA primase
MSENNLIAEIKNKINIVDLISEYLSLQKKGKNFISLCPFHEDSHPSMSISEEKQIFNCFSCNVGGDAIGFLSKYKKIPYRSAVEELATKLNLNFKSQKFTPIYVEKEKKIIDILNDTALYFENELYSDNGTTCLEYLKSRKIDNECISRHKIGFSNSNLIKYLNKKYDMSEIISSGLATQKEEAIFKNRLIFPIENIHGDVIGFSARTLENDYSKYINSPNSQIFSKSKIFYNFHNAKQEIFSKKEIIITEGFFDVIAIESIGLQNVVAIMGTALTREHLKLLKNYSVTLMLDSDKAGIISMNKSIALLLSNKNLVNIVINNENLDPDEFLKKYGKEKLAEAIDLFIDIMPALSESNIRVTL